MQSDVYPIRPRDVKSREEAEDMLRKLHGALAKGCFLTDVEITELLYAVKEGR
jgi:hypothetical protein